MSLADYKIIMIHGLASKPPKEDLLNYWKKCIIENIAQYDKELSRQMQQDHELFEMAYWANVIPNHIEEDPKKLERPVQKIIEIRKKMGDSFHTPKPMSKVKAFWKNLGVEAIDIVTNVLTVKDDVLKKSLLEIKLYWDDQYIATNIRQILASVLRKALRENKKVIIISHSMGTFIAYDVLWRFCHHRDEEDMWDKRVHTFVTMGSPLGDEMIQDLMLGKRYGFKTKQGALSNIDYWANFAALGDIVCHDQTLTDEFRRTEGLKDFRDYKRLYNPYKNERGKANPHKSYGYLLQPKLAKTLLRFFGKLEW
ncbi:lipase/acyltransferase domain-containing protein [Nitrosophilus alvini]|uniref:PGAP1-like alpha/beta domain-containing protein n=1 Tax=Nitrosophilus alvini TaxID=2714855 RepID=UPI00190D4BC5|nr:hypothetical protein [Nitrosophilus alvini]